MRSQFGQPINLHDLAAEVFLSPFHFSRVFSANVGIPPGRFLTAVRLYEAKLRLLSRNDTVADVVCSVGYSSVGTFTTRFTKAVGITPGRYRDRALDGVVLVVAPETIRVPRPAVLARATGDGPGAAEVAVRFEDAGPGSPVVVAAFEGDVPQGIPTAMAVAEPGATGAVLRGLPAGRTVLLAVAVGEGGGTVASAPIRVGPGEKVVRPVSLRFRSPVPTDAPIAVPLLADGVRRAARDGAAPSVVRPAA